MKMDSKTKKKKADQKARDQKENDFTCLKDLCLNKY